MFPQFYWKTGINLFALLSASAKGAAGADRRRSEGSRSAKVFAGGLLSHANGGGEETGGNRNGRTQLGDP